MDILAKSQPVRNVAVAPRQVAPPDAEPVRRMSVEVVRHRSELAQYIADLETLAAGAIEPNVFYEHWMLLPALEWLVKDEDLRCVLIFSPDPARPSRRILCGLFPLQRVRRYKMLPVACYTLWKYRYGCLCTPLVRSDCAAECLKAFFDWLDAERGGPVLLEMGLLTADGPFQQQLVEHFGRCASTVHTTESFTRALLRPGTDAETYLHGSLPRKKRKEFKRQANRLAESGRVEYAVLEPDGPLDQWIAEFLDLEASGWKGRSQTAFACHAADREFFAAITRAAFARGRLMLLALRVDGRPIAMKCNLLAADGAFAFKIAFDERWRQYSPGALLELENIRRVHAQPGLTWMDSCAVADHFMANQLWGQRRTMQSLLVATGRPFGDLLVSSVPLLRWGYRRIRPAARSAGGNQ